MSLKEIIFTIIALLILSAWVYDELTEGEEKKVEMLEQHQHFNDLLEFRDQWRQSQKP